MVFLGFAEVPNAQDGRPWSESFIEMGVVNMERQEKRLLDVATVQELPRI